MPFFEIFDHSADVVFALNQSADAVIYANQSARQFAPDDLKLLEMYQRHLKHPDANVPLEGSVSSYLVQTLSAADETGQPVTLVRAVQVAGHRPQEKDAWTPSSLLDKVVPLDTPSGALYALLQDLGERFDASGAIIYAVEHQRIVHSVQWARTEDLTDSASLRHSEIGDLLKSYLEQSLIGGSSSSLILTKDAKLQAQHPMEYALLREFNLDNVAIRALSSSSQEVLGFLIVCSVAPQHLDLCRKELHFYSMVAASLLKKRRMFLSLRYLKDRDELTEAFNRRAFERQLQVLRFHKSLGVICAQIPDLKELNQKYGLQYCDELLQQTFQCLKTIMPSFPIFRSRGNVFTAVLKDLSQDQLNTFKLRAGALLKSQHCAVELTSAFADQPCTLEDLISRTGLNGPALPHKPQAYQSAPLERDFDSLPQHPFVQYVQQYHFDDAAMWQSLSENSQTFYIYCGDLQANVFFLSDNMRDTFGFEHSIVPDMLSIWPTLIADDHDREIWNEDLARTLKDPHYRHSLRYRVTDAGGARIWVHCRGRVIFNDKGEPVFMSGSLMRLDDRNLVCPVTNLQREYAAVKDISRLIELEHSCTIYAIKFFEFNEINEHIGHEAANQLLHAIAEKLTDQLGDSMKFYRLDGITIIGVSKSRDLDTEQNLKEQIFDIASSTYSDFGFGSRRCASITAIRYPEHIESAEELFEKISGFEAIAKREMLPFIEFTAYDAEAQRRQAGLVLKLSSSVEHDFEGFSTVAQPVVSSAPDHRIIGAEILIRWADDNLNIGPTAFIPVLEQTKLIVQVGRFVFREAAKLVKRAIRYAPDFFVSFNVSYVQIKEDPGFFDYIKDTLLELQLTGNHFVAELTETNFDACPEKLSAFISSCRQIGVYLALDDFGNGYSSLNLLLKYPAAIIKLDRSLTVKVHESQKNLNFIKAVIYACHQMGRKVCVEGVETAQELASIEETQCDYIQGYYFFRPLKPDDLLAKIFLQQQLLVLK